MLETCQFHDRSLVMVTPKYLTESDIHVETGVEFIRIERQGLDFIQVMTRSVLFARLSERPAEEIQSHRVDIVLQDGIIISSREDDRARCLDVCKITNQLLLATGSAGFAGVGGACVKCVGGIVMKIIIIV